MSSSASPQEEKISVIKEISDKTAQISLHILPQPKMSFEVSPNTLELDPASSFHEKKKQMKVNYPCLLSMYLSKANPQYSKIYCFLPTFFILRMKVTDPNFEKIIVTLSSTTSKLYKPQAGYNFEGTETESLSFEIINSDSQQKTQQSSKNQSTEQDKEIIQYSKYGAYIPFQFISQMAPKDLLNLSYHIYIKHKPQPLKFQKEIIIPTLYPIEPNIKVKKVNTNSYLAEISLFNFTDKCCEDLVVHVKTSPSFISDKTKYAFSQPFKKRELVSCVFAFEETGEDKRRPASYIANITLTFKINGKQFSMPVVESIVAENQYEKEEKQKALISMIRAPKTVNILETFTVKVEIHSLLKNPTRFYLSINSSETGIVPHGTASFLTNTLSYHESQMFELNFIAAFQGLHYFPPISLKCITTEDDISNDSIPFDTLTIEN